MAAVLGCAVSELRTGEAVAEETQSAEHIMTKSGYGPDWESASYGKNGWVIFASEGQTSGTENDPKTVYSDLYTENADYDAETKSIVLSGRKTNAENTWLTTGDGKTLDAAEQLRAGIDKWAFCGRAWREAAIDSLYVPGTEISVQARMDGWNTTLQDTSVVINKTSAEPLYFTSYVFVGNTAQVTPVAPLEFYVFSGANLTPNNSDELLDHYGEELAHTTVTISNSYVTFCLEGTGEFQIVAAKSLDENGNAIGSQAPYLGGFFLDDEFPFATEAKAQHVLTTDAYGPNWEVSPYGNNGRTLLSTTGGKNENEERLVYSDLYTESASYDPETGTVALSGWTANDSNTWLTTENGETVAASAELNPGIDKWAFGARAWNEDAQTSGLLAPGGAEGVGMRLDGWGGYNSQKDLEDTSIAVNKTTSEPLYLTVYVFSRSGGGITPAAPVDLYVYYGANLGANRRDTLDHYNTLLCEETQVTSEGSYVTFLLEGTGEFQIVAAKSVPDGEAPFLGGFFLDRELTPVMETMNVSLEGKIAAFFRYAIPDGTADENAYLSMTVNGIEQKAYLKDAETDGDGRYTFECRLAAAQMTDKINLQLKSGAGENLGRAYAYSVRDYADVLLAGNGTDERKELVGAMLYYGASAQVLFDYHTENPANAGCDFTPDEIALETLPETKTEGDGAISLLSYDCRLESETTMRLYFQFGEGTGVENCEFVLISGREEILTPETDEEGRLYVDISGIAAPELDDMFTIQIREAGGGVLFSVQTSVICYVRDVLECETASEAMKDVAEALYFYAVAASAYFQS